ncbi:MAG: AarF/ABC1/UbiB kinase family protein [Deltaproteobacteria bacterium]|jgi:predicted unusual protein kinase regulating ubiquinone biosynthesis (AarF/ABC1/UbiB family)|nr:AarF/ABC1/UbiB kinase family protein [Deltaproteobacteria bacterium]
MAEEIPRGKWQRGLTGSKTAARMSRKALKYLARKPFLTEEKRQEERKALNRENAVLLFEGLSLLRGTALKMAQLLSMELDIFPPEITKELQKSYHRVPPINRALVRKTMQNALGKPPELIFEAFEPTAFAAASLGQVHRATTRDGDRLAVKIQYPGIRETIQNDVQLMRSVLRPLPEYRMIVPAIEEIETRLLEETDYRRELENMAFFKERLRMDRIIVPAPYGDYSTDTVLSAEHVSGLTLNEWLNTGPDRRKRDRLAQTLHDLFIFGLYRLHRIHADPNPGNFIVNGDKKIGLVDFGCVKRFDPEFVALYGELPQTALQGGRSDYMRLLKALNIAGPAMAPEVEDHMFKVFHETGQWLGKLYQEEYFDFKTNPDFIAAGKKMMARTFELRKHMDINTNFIFLHRTRYGLLRLFEQMGARVSFRNPYEYS